MGRYRHRQRRRRRSRNKKLIEKKTVNSKKIMKIPTKITARGNNQNPTRHFDFDFDNYGRYNISAVSAADFSCPPPPTRTAIIMVCSSNAW